MDTARHGWRRSTRSARFAVPLLVVVLSVAGFVVTARAVDDERGNAADRQAEIQALAVQRQLERARAFGIGLGNALAGERVPDGRRFAALEGSATTLADARSTPASIDRERTPAIASLVAAGGAQAYAHPAEVMDGS